MSTENDATVAFYKKYAGLYLQRNQVDYSKEQGRKDDNVHRDYILRSIAGLPKDARMFEVGSGSGRDAALIRSMGYDIQVSDVAEAFLVALKERNFEPISFDLVHDEFPGKFDYILANAVLVHFTKAEVKMAVQKAYSALRPHGTFAFSLKKRTDHDEEWKSNIPGTDMGRYFSYWEAKEVKELLDTVGFQIEDFQQNDGLRARWIDIIAKK